MIWALDHAQGDLNSARANLEAWFNATMDRVSGRYKRRTQLVLFLIGLAVAVVLNIDAITVAQRLSQDKPLREAAIAQATKASSTMTYEEARDNLQNIGYPIGWKQWWPDPQKTRLQCVNENFCLFSIYIPSAVGVLLGWLITTLAVMLGAPFWFDVLNKFMVIRSTVKPHEKSPEEASEDRQQPPSLW